MPVLNGVVHDPVTCQPIGLYKGVDSSSFYFAQLFENAQKVLNEFLYEYYQLNSEKPSFLQEQALRYTQKWEKSYSQKLPISTAAFYLKDWQVDLGGIEYQEIVTREFTFLAQKPLNQIFTTLCDSPIIRSGNAQVTPAYILCRLLVKRRSYSGLCSLNFRLFLFRKYPDLHIKLEGYTNRQLLIIINNL